MTVSKKTLRVCKNGHQYYKSSDWPTCPVCEQQRKPVAGFLASLAAPTRRALESAGIKTLQQLAQKSKAEILNLHGMGPGSIPTLRKVLQAEGLSFNKKQLK